MNIEAFTESGLKIFVNEQQLNANTCDALLEDIFHFDGIKISLNIPEDKMPKVRFKLLYSEWAETMSSDLDNVNQFKERMGNYMNDNAVEYNSGIN